MHYRKVSTAIWNDEKFRTLSDDAQLVFFFLLTHPHQTSLGAMRASIPGLAAEKGWALPRFKRSFAEIQSQGMVRHDAGASFVWLPNFLKHNGPENPNVVKSWSRSLGMLPECRMKHELITHVKEFIETLPEGFVKALPEPFLKGLAIQEQEQEQEPKQEQEKEKKGAIPSGDILLVISKINELGGKNYSPDSDIVKKGLVSRLRAGASAEDCLLVVTDRYQRWKDKPDMMEHFNPETLFRPTKFEKYLNEAKARRDTEADTGESTKEFFKDAAPNVH